LQKYLLIFSCRGRACIFPVPGVSSRAVMPSENTARISEKNQGTAFVGLNPFRANGANAGRVGRPLFCPPPDRGPYPTSEAFVV